MRKETEGICGFQEEDRCAPLEFPISLLGRKLLLSDRKEVLFINFLL